MNTSNILTHIHKHIQLSETETHHFIQFLQEEKVNKNEFILHVPMIGEWVALPLLHLAGSKKPGDDIWNEIQYPVAHRLLEKCDAVLRIPGVSKGADMDVKIAKERGLMVFYNLDEIPDA